MSLFALPVTVSDLTTLQSGIQFFTNTAEATTEVGSINANQPNDSVFIYATKLLANNISLSQVAMATSALMEGGTIPVGNATTSNTLTLLATVFLPPQVAFALLPANNFNPTVFAAESLGSALSTTAGFQSFVGLTTSQFAQSVSTLTGVNVSAIQTFVANWTTFFTNNPIALQGRTVTQAAYGSAFGDAVGTALLNPTTANLQTIVSTTPGVNQFIPNTIQGLTANALIDIATGQYVTGKALGALPQHTDLQGEASVTQGGVFLTQNIDSPTAGFSLSQLGTPLLNGFTATQAGVIFQAPAFVTALGIAVNTLNSGDNLQDTVGDGKLVLQDVALTIGANPPFATNVTMNGLKTLDITNQAAFTPGGFQGNITGLTIENNNGSIAPVTLGGTGQGLKTLLTDININNYGGLAGSDLNTVILAAGIGGADKTINISFTGGNLGTTKDGGAQEIAISSDVPGGTKAAPNLTYGTWALTINNNANLQLEQNVTTDGTGAVTAEGGVGEVGGATTLSLTGKGNIALSQDQIGEWRLLKTANAAGESGTVIITGATAGVLFNAKGTGPVGTNNPFWLFGGDFGFLDNTGTGDFALTEFDLGSGTNVLDVSTATAAQIGALKTVPNATPSAINEIIVQNAVATTLSADTFKNIAGFNILGIGGPTVAQGAAGTIDLKLLPASISTIEYFTPANGSVTINNQTLALTVNVFDQTTGAQTLTVNGPPGLADNFTLSVGNANHNNAAFVPNLGAGNLGLVTVFGDEVVAILALGSTPGGPDITDNLGGVNLTPSLGGNEQVAIQGTTKLSLNGGLFEHDPGSGFINSPSTLTVVDTDTAGVAMFTGLTLAPANFKVPLNFSTNAISIDATNPGGLFMMAGDFSVTFAPSPLQSSGDVIKGSMTSTKGDVLAGSIGNDTFFANDVGFADTVVTFGGADKITLAANHTGKDVIDLYAGSTGVLFFGGGDMPATPGSVVFAGVPADVPEPGWWGQGSGSVPVGYTGAPGASVYAGLADFTGTGTPTHPANLSVVNGFIPGQDIVSFSVSSFGGAVAPNGLAPLALGFGLVDGGNFETALGGPQVVAVQQVNPGGVLAAGTNIIELTTGSFANANAVVQALANNYDIVFTGAGAFPGDSFHVLVAYQLQGSGAATNIMDLAVNTQSFGTVFHTEQSIPLVNHLDLHGSDVIELVGVNVTQLANANFHIVA